MEEKILSSINSPKDLEYLYWENPDGFRKAFPAVFSNHPESMVLQVWYERITFHQEDNVLNKEKIWSFKNILLIALLTLIAGTILKLPITFEKIDTEWFYSRILAEIFIVPLMIYFFFQKPHSKTTILIILGLTAGACLYLAFLPYDTAGSYWEFRSKFRSFADAIAVAELHIPILLWLILGIAFAGEYWRNTIERMNFMKYNGEVIVYTTIVMLSGGVLVSITYSLLELMPNSYELSKWYDENIIPYGFAAAPIVATFLIDKVIGRRFNLAPTLARIFIPLFLITTIAYLIVLTVYRQSPFNDRESLIAFNFLLIIVLGLLMFSIAERDPDIRSGLSDYLNIGLVLTTLVIDLVALFAVLYRMSSDAYGFTPNRIAILGINILVFCHLVGILYYYIRFASKKDSFMKLENWIAGYLPAYAIWSFAISIMLPLIFWYK